MGLFDHIPLKIISHRNFYLLGLSILLAGLCWSNYLMSLGQIVILVNWILELDFKRKWNTIKEHNLLLVLFSLFALHLVGVLWTSDFAYAQKDILNKLSLFVLPLCIGTSTRLNKKEFQNLLLIYVFSAFIITILSLLKLLGHWGEPIIDKRKLAVYISHIRYGLNLAMAVIFIFYHSKNYSKFLKILLWLISAWFILCLFLFELTTGLICLISAGLLIVSFRILSHKTKAIFKVGILGLTSLILALGIFEVHTIKKDFYKAKTLDYDQEKLNVKSDQGNLYYHNSESDLQVNGVYLWRFIQDKELKAEWNKRSTIKLDSSDKKGQPLLHTLVRFLSSKGLKKDSLGISQLNEIEIKAIEKGIAHEYYINHNPIQNRIHKIIYEYENYTKGGVVNGFSLAMRLEYWKNTWQIIKANPVIGVGTGDIQVEIDQNYEKNNSVLEDKYRKRTHNQYLTFWATFGLIGLLVFMFYLIYPLCKIHAENRRIYFVFFLIAALSFITEDTLETQAGVAFFALFNSLILLGLPLKK